jgi:hypothetical protein
MWQYATTDGIQFLVDGPVKNNSSDSILDWDMISNRFGKKTELEDISMIPFIDLLSWQSISNDIPWSKTVERFEREFA